MRILVTLLVVSSLVSGCGRKEPSSAPHEGFVGIYSHSSKAIEEIPSLDQPPAVPTTQLAAMRLELLADETFTFVQSMEGIDSPGRVATGEWEVRDGKIYFEFLTRDGEPVSMRDIVEELGAEYAQPVGTYADGVLTITPPCGRHMLVLRRE